MQRQLGTSHTPSPMCSLHAAPAARAVSSASPQVANCWRAPNMAQPHRVFPPQHASAVLSMYATMHSLLTGTSCQYTLHFYGVHRGNDGPQSQRKVCKVATWYPCWIANLKESGFRGYTSKEVQMLYEVACVPPAQACSV